MCKLLPEKGKHAKSCLGAQIWPEDKTVVQIVPTNEFVGVKRTGGEKYCILTFVKWWKILTIPLISLIQLPFAENLSIQS